MRGEKGEKEGKEADTSVHSHISVAHWSGLYSHTPVHVSHRHPFLLYHFCFITRSGRSETKYHMTHLHLEWEHGKIKVLRNYSARLCVCV